MSTRMAPARLSLRRKLLIAFVAFLLALAAPFGAVLVIVNGAARELSDMQSRQAEISGFIAATEEAYNVFSKFLLNGDDRYQREFEASRAAIGGQLDRLDRELPGEFHYYVYDLHSMVASFSELANSIRADYLAGTARIFLDKRMAELARHRDYLKAEYTDLLTAYLSHVREASLRLRHALDSYQFIIAAALAALLIAGGAVAARISTDIAAPVHELALSLERFSSGDLEAPPLVVRRNDEIGVVVAAFNRMTTEIRAHVSSIREKAAMEAELADQTLRALEAENALKRAEMRYLQAQVNPHFLYNSLNSLLSLARIEEAPRTAESAESLALLLRATLRSGKAMTSLGEEFEIVSNYLKVQKLRFGRRLDYELDLPEGLYASRVPAMILQPFVENAVIHGIEPATGGGRVVVGAEPRGDGVVMTVVDDGVGFVPADCLAEEGDEGLHIGIANTTRRLALLYGEGRKRVVIESAPGAGTRIRIEVPGRLIDEG